VCVRINAAGKSGLKGTRAWRRFLKGFRTSVEVYFETSG
jgi:hypothetical protein